MITFEEAHTWLNRGQSGYMSDTTRQLLARLGVALSTNHQTEAWRLIRRLESLYRSACKEMEIAEALVECGVIAYRHQGYKQAIEFFELALLRYGFRWHFHAVVKWMIGHVLWQIPGEDVEAARAWRRSIEKFSSLANSRLLSRSEVAWYNEKSNKMSEALIIMIADQVEDAHEVRFNPTLLPAELISVP